MPGVLIIEALAQTGAVCALSADEYKGKIAFLGGVNKAKSEERLFQEMC